MYCQLNDSQSQMVDLNFDDGDNNNNDEFWK